MMQIENILVAIMAVLMFSAGTWGWWNEHYAPEDREYSEKQSEKGKR